MSCGPRVPPRAATLHEPGRRAEQQSRRTGSRSSRSSTSASGVTSPETSCSPSPWTTSSRTALGFPPGSTVNMTPARLGSSIRITTAAMARSRSSMPRNHRYDRGDGYHIDAQTFRTASCAPAGSTLRYDSYWPANEAPPRSSAVAEERTASCSPADTSVTSRSTASATARGRGIERKISSTYPRRLVLSGRRHRCSPERVEKRRDNGVGDEHAVRARRHHSSWRHRRPSDTSRSRAAPFPPATDGAIPSPESRKPSAALITCCPASCRTRRGAGTPPGSSTHRATRR